MGESVFRFKDVLRKGIDKIFLVFSTLMVMFPISPVNSPTTNIDSGVFLYFGWRILEGDVPYVDIWDHKPPVIYYLNALGLSLTNGSRWGVWLIEFIVVFFAAYLGFKLFEKVFGKTAALVATFLWLFNLVFLLLSGNLTEEYALVLQFGSLLLFYKLLEGEAKTWFYLVIGILGGIAFLTKQTTIGLWVAYGIVLLIPGLTKQETKKRYRHLGLMIAGIFLVLLLITSFFYFQNGLSEFLDQAFRYSFLYSKTQSTGIFERIKDAFNLKYLSHYSLFPIAAIGIVLLISNQSDRKESKHGRLLIIVAIDLIIEFLLINLPGHAYEHYYITILPALAVFCGFAISKISFDLGDWQNRWFTPFLIAISLIFLLTVGSLREYGSNLLSLRVGYDAEAITYVEENTESSETVFIWGTQHAMVNFYSKRASPTKFIYVSPLLRSGYTNEDIIMEFLEELEKELPVLMINAEPKKGFMIFPIKTTAIQQKVDQLMSHYYLPELLGDWPVYKLRQD